MSDTPGIGKVISTTGKVLLAASVASMLYQEHEKRAQREAEELAEIERENERREIRRQIQREKEEEYNKSPEGIAEAERKKIINDQINAKNWEIKQIYSRTEECYQLAKEETIRCQCIPVCTDGIWGVGSFKGQYFSMPIPDLEDSKFPYGLPRALIGDIIERMENEGIISKASPNAPDVSGYSYYDENVRRYYNRKVLVPQKYEDWYADQNIWTKFWSSVDRMWNNFTKWYLS